MTTLTRASREWSKRPADERFSSLEALHAKVTDVKARHATAEVVDSDLRVKVLDGELVLNGKTDTNAKLTNWSFGQLCSGVEAPASYLGDLPAELAAECLNHGLADVEDDKSALLFDRSPERGLVLRSMNGMRYSRIWNADITSRLLRLKNENGWNEAPAAFDGSRGMYAGDRDMFCFMVDNDRRIFERDPNGGLSRGFFCWNSEVGAATFGVMTFLYNYVCGNHMVWGASNVNEVRIRHVGDAADRGFGELTAILRQYADSAASDDEMKIGLARNFQIGATKDEVLDRIFGLKVPGLTRKLVNDAYDLAEQRVDWYGNPRSAWGMSSGITEIARDIEYADARVSLERAGAKVMEMAF